MEPVLDHIQITVRDMDVAMPFYEKLLPILGFDPASKSTAVLEKHDMQVMEFSHPRMGFAISSPRKALKEEPVHRRRPGALHHLAFKVETQAEVNRLYETIKEIGADIVDVPRVYPEHHPHPYYALFFKDPDGIKYEIVCTNPPE